MEGARRPPPYALALVSYTRPWGAANADKCCIALLANTHTRGCKSKHLSFYISARCVCAHLNQSEKKLGEREREKEESASSFPVQMSSDSDAVVGAAFVSLDGALRIYL